MGKGDRRNSNKMRQRKRMNHLKERNRRRRQGVARQPSGVEAPKESGQE